MVDLLHLCNVKYDSILTTIWATITPISNGRAQADMESTCCYTTKLMRFRAPHPPHYIVVIVLALALYTEETDGVGDSLNVLIFTDL